MSKHEEIEWTVKKLIIEDNYVLHLFFADGKEGLLDFKPYLEERPFDRLIKENRFNDARVAFGTVIWGDDIDIAPEELYEKSVPVKK